MSIRVTCPGCQGEFTTDDSHAGKRAKCPTCGAPIEVPFPVADPESFDELLDEVAPAGSDSDRKPCPMCGEMIMSDAVKCRFCGEVFDPELKREADRKARDSEPDASLSTGEIVLAVLCSTIGCVMGVIWMIQGKPKGLKMVGASLAAAFFWNVLAAIVQNIAAG